MRFLFREEVFGSFRIQALEVFDLLGRRWNQSRRSRRRRANRRQHPQGLIGRIHRRRRHRQQRLEITRTAEQHHRATFLAGTTRSLGRSTYPHDRLGSVAAVPQRCGCLQAPTDVFDVLGQRLWEKR